MVIGSVTWSAHLRTIASSRIGSRNSSASDLMCSTTSVPAVSRVAGAMVNCPAPSEAQVNASSEPALRRGDLDPVGDHEGGVEADAELADQAGPLLGLGRGQRGAERAGAGTGDGAEIVDQLLPPHADAVVGDQQCARLLVGNDADLGLGRGRQGAVGQRLETAPVHRIGRVRDQFPQEYLPLGIERMHHEIEQPPDLGAKIMLFLPPYRSSPALLAGRDMR